MVAIKLRRKYTHTSPFPQYKSPSGNSGKSSQKKKANSADRKNIKEPRKMAMFMDGGTGHCVMREIP